MVVDYMVDEALVASLSEIVQSADGDGNWMQDRLRYLLDHSDAFDDADDLFTAAEREAVVHAIAQVKILDPAVGSGAFPMSMLHKLTLALRRLDTDNRFWERLQRERAIKRSEAAYEEATNQEERDAELKDISGTFEKYRDSDFGRKLHLIQNSIYGVDIQPVATQIAKLRFFISLAIEQEPDYTTENYGIKPLPNLETRFIAANTLLSLRSLQGHLPPQPIIRLQVELQDNREKHFHANTRAVKSKYRRVDKRLRESIAAELTQSGWESEDADKIASWDPYDQNASADWFDPEYMFGVSGGFDVVIGNPPYIQLQKDGGKLRQLYKDAGYQTFASTGDIYQLFYERGCHLLTPSTGLVAYITSNSWLKAEYGKSTRRYFAERHMPLRLLEMGKDIFEAAIVDSSILLAREGRVSEAASAVSAVDVDRLPDREFPPAPDVWGEVRPQGEAPWSILSRTEQSIMDKMHAVGTPLKEWDIEINYGIKTGYNRAFIIDNQTKEALVAEDPKVSEIIKPVVRGRDISRYQAQWPGLWLIATFPSLGLSIEDYPAVKHHLLRFGKARLEQAGKTLPDGTKSRKKTRHAWYELQDTCAYHEDFTKEKLLWIELVNDGRFAYDNSGFYGEATTFLLTGESIKYLCAVLNSKLIRWFLEKVASTSGMGTLRWKKVYVERLPIPRLSVRRQQSFAKLVDGVLMLKGGQPESDTSETEARIDEKVYKLFGLTPLEISVVDQRP